MPVNRGEVLGMAQAPEEEEAGHPETDNKMETEVTFWKGSVGYMVTHDELSPSDADVNSLADNASTKCRH